MTATSTNAPATTYEAFAKPDVQSDGFWLQAKEQDGFEALALAGDKTKTVYRKELIYEGDFQLQDPSGRRFPSKIDVDMLRHWANTATAMLSNGNEIPIPIEHTRNTEARRGKAIKLAVEKNSRGGMGLFGYIEFKDEKSAEANKDSQVSIWVDPEFVDGKGNRYHKPIRHIALTDYPVIPGLDNFEAIAASLLSVPQKKDDSMTIRELAKKLGVEVADDAKDDAVETLVLSHVEKMQTSNDELTKRIDALEQASKQGGGKTDPPASTATDPVKVSSAMLSMGKEHRGMKIKALADTGKITPAVAKKLEAQFCSDEAVTLVLSDQGSDGFDGVLAALSENEKVISFQEKSGPQSLAGLNDLKLSADDLNKSGEESPLVKGMEKRAEAHRQQYAGA